MKLKALSALLLFCVLAAVHVSAEEPSAAIEKGKKVVLNYTLTVDGKVVDSSVNGEPLAFVYGEMALMPGFEKAILGLKKGEKKHMVLSPEEAYGPLDPKALVEVPKANFPAEPEIQPGMVFTTHDPQGGDLNATVKELRGDKVLLDFNHPLAGKTLTFDIEIISIT